MRRGVRIVLFSDLNLGTSEEVVGIVSNSLGWSVLVSENQQCEAESNPARQQWLAGTMIERCIKRFSSPNSYAVGLTDKDLYVPGLNFVFGLALREMGAAVVSWHRLLGDEGILAKRIGKEVIHEVGHLEGLAHCTNEGCVMWFSNTLQDTDKKTSDFCPECKRTRIEVGT